MCQTRQLFLNCAALQHWLCGQTLQHVVAGSFSGLPEIMNQVLLDLFWCAPACKAQGNVHLIVCILLRLSVCQWGNGHRKFSWPDPRSCPSDRFEPPRLFLQLFVFSSFTVWEDSFASATIMQKHSMNPFILQISPTKSPCVHLTACRAFTWSSCQQDLFCGEPVNFVHVRPVNKPTETYSLRSLCGISLAGASLMMNVCALETLFLYFVPWKGNNRRHFYQVFPSEKNHKGQCTTFVSTGKEQERVLSLCFGSLWTL